MSTACTVPRNDSCQALLIEPNYIILSVKPESLTDRAFYALLEDVDAFSEAGFLLGSFLSNLVSEGDESAVDCR